MFVSWVLFPIVLAALCLGCGLLLEAATGRRLPGSLLAPGGFAVVVVIAGTFTARGETASLATPAVIAAALAGAGLALRGRRGASFDGWLFAGALALFAVYAAPVVFSGEPTFTGYVKLDDTATWLAFIDRVMDHGRDLSGLEPSSYLSTLEVNLPQGYPVGAFLPLGVGGQLTGTDVAWLVQPYMAAMAALLAMALYGLAAPLIESRPLRALAAFGAAQSALLFAYGLWGGIKEIAAALVIVLLAASLPTLARPGVGWRETLPPAVATAALLIMVGSGAVVWIGPLMALAAVGVCRARGFAGLLTRAWPLALLVVVLGVPALLAADVFSPTQGGLTDAAELGNLFGPLDVAQYVGIWPNGDFRLDPLNEPLTALLITLALAAAGAGAWIGWRQRSWGLLLYAAAAAVGSLVVFAYSSPWVGAKALASGSPSFLLLALTGAAAFAARVERVFGTTVLTLLLAGVLWSNALGYHDAWLAPYDQLRELEQIGEEFAGAGPTLMTEYQPYGVRHFLRAADAEGASELRARPVPLVDGGEAEKGASVDTDQIAFATLLSYRTLVLRRSPAQSRPPSTYSRVFHGDFYDVWQRPSEPGYEIVQRLGLGEFPQAAAAPSCGEVIGLAALTGPGGRLAAVPRRPNLIVSLSEGRYPSTWAPTAPDSRDLVPGGPGTVRIAADVEPTGTYDLFVQGSVRNPLRLEIDDVEVGASGYQLNPNRQFLDLGRARIRAGRHVFDLTLDGQSLAPGSGGPPEPIGPLVLSPVRAEAAPALELPASRARELCGRVLDWVEAVR